ncbi:MAG: DUF4168 domain-containing protein [Acetobacteraceae bacterium]|nr:DUF4168 domain-containing protein [Acetobacteraceae bacterium]
MTRFKTTLLLATMLTTAMAGPLAAQQMRTREGASPGATGASPGTRGTSANIPDATVQKTGAALRDVAGIQEEFSQRVQAAPAPEQRQRLVDQASQAATRAINKHGLSVEEYNRVIQLTQTDPDLKERVLAAANAAR